MANRGRRSKGKGVASSSSGLVAARSSAARSADVVPPAVDHVTTDPSPTLTGSTADTPSQSLPTDLSSNNRVHLEVEDNSFIPGHTAARQITKIFTERLDRQGYTWKDVSQQTKEFYWSEFQKYFVFDPMPERLIEKAWRKKASKCYSQLLYKFRHHGKPDRLSQETWNCWVRFWKSAEFKKKRKQASISRHSEVAGPGSGLSRHACGSKSAKEHARDLEMILKRKPNEYELSNYIQTKKKDRGKYVDISEKVVNEVLRSLERSPGPSVETETDPDGANHHVPDKCTEAVGGDKKRRLDSTSNDHSSSKAAKTVPPPSNWERLLDEAFERGRAEGRAELENKMNALMQETQRMGKKLSMLMEHLGGSRVFGKNNSDDDDGDDDANWNLD